MAGKVISYGSDLSQEGWQIGATLEAERATICMALAGTEENSCFRIVDGNVSVGKTGRPTRGEQVTVRFGVYNDDPPKTRSETTVGQEDYTQNFEDTVQVRYFKKDGGVENQAFDQTLTSVPLKQQEVSRMSVEWAHEWDKGVLRHMCGDTTNNSATDYKYTLGNVVTAPNTANWRFVDDSSGTNANETAVGADATSRLTTDELDYMVMMANSKDYVTYPIAPAQTPWGELYPVICSWQGYRQIRNSDTGGQFYDIYRAKIEGGGDFYSNPILTGQPFIYNRCLVFGSDFCPAGAVANTKRGVLLGACAGHFVFSEGYHDGNHLGYSEHEVHHYLSMLLDTGVGFKRTIVNSVSWGAITFTHYSDV